MDSELYSTRNKRVHDHKCGLLEEEEAIVRYITGGIFVNFRRTFRRMLMVNPKSPETQAILKSTCEIRQEEEKHLHFNYHVIHPFSSFRMKWETFMILVYFTLMILIPMDVCLHRSVTFPFIVFKFIFDLISMVDIGLFFFTGYLNNKTQKIILSQRKITVHYLTHFFIFDVISTLPIGMILYLSDNLFFTGVHYLKPIMFIKAVRMPTLLRYIRKFCERMNIQSYNCNIINFVLLVFMFILWGTCILFGLAINDPPYQGIPETFHDQFLTLCCALVMKFLLVGTTKEDIIYNNYELALQPICIVIGGVLYVVLLAQITQIYNRYASSRDKYNNLVQQIGEYMEYKELPYSLQEKVFHYVDFKFQKNIYKEANIINSLSSILKDDILLHNCEKLVAKVDYFKDLPTSLMLRIALNLKSEIYLPNDTIVQAGITGNAMYFIYIGTVAVYTKSGKEICHLYDGSHFGEIALVINEPRVATCVAVKECELFRLSRKDFHEAIQPFPELCNKIRASALARLESTRKIMEQNPDSDLSDDDN